MNQAAFETQLRQDGFEVVTNQMKPNEARPEHSHPWDVRALVLSGDITLTCGGTATRYAAGEVFTMAAGTPHLETVGPAGVSYVAGRRPTK